MAVHRFVDGVVQHFPDEVVESGRADAADVHAWPFPDRLEPLQNRDVFRGVVRGCHVYNVRLVPRFACACLLIVAAFHVELAAAASATEDVPVPGGVAALAHAVGIDPAPDRSRSMVEATRLVYETVEIRS